MGAGCCRKCPKCGFEFYNSTGVGFLFPKVYAKTVQKAEDGELGIEIQTFFTEHKNGAVNAELVTLCCNECGNLSSDMDLTMYVPNDKKPKKTENKLWSGAFPFEGEDSLKFNCLYFYNICCVCNLDEFLVPRNCLIKRTTGFAPATKRLLDSCSTNCATSV